MRIAVSGMLAGVPYQGGASWAVLQYVLGLRRLGHDVIFVEPVPSGGAHPGSCAARYFRAVADAYGLERAALIDTATGATTGMSRPALLGALRGADLLLNLSGTLADEELLGAVGVRAFVDLDPGFTQLWAAEGVELGFERHDRFVTIGMALGTPGCRLPTVGRRWIRTPQPIVLEHWPVAGRLVRDAATTVGHWRSYGPIEHDGVHYGQKAHAVRELLDLPRLSATAIAPALAIHPGDEADRAALRRHGWRLLDPAALAATPWAYQAFVQGSRAELGLAKSGYVAAACGWFSDRSICYLASGRPVVAHDTGFADWLPVGEGLLAFATAAEAAAGLAALAGDYARHRRAARSIAEEHFDSDRVLTRLLACL
jgi:hypothetical protein